MRRRLIPNKPPPPPAAAPTAAPRSLYATAATLYRALLTALDDPPRFGPAEYQCPDYARTGHYDALAEVREREARGRAGLGRGGQGKAGISVAKPLNP